MGKCEFITGKISGKFTFTKEILQNDFLKNEFSVAEDFTVICQDQNFKFHKNYLSTISPVFKTMINDSYIESENGTVKIEDTEPEIIQAFKNVLYHDSIYDEDLTPQLLMFAKQYLIEPLMHMFRNNLVNNLSNENVVDAIKVAYWNEDEELLKCGVKYVVQNLGTFEDNPDYDDFLKAHPDFSVKIMKMMMCKK